MGVILNFLNLFKSIGKGWNHKALEEGVHSLLGLGHTFLDGIIGIGAVSQKI